MRPVEKHPELQNMLRVLRIITLMLPSGVGLLIGVVHFQGLAGANFAGDPFITYVAVGMAPLAILVFAFVRVAMVRKARDLFARGDVEGFRQAYMGATIVWFAGLEGPGLFCGVAYLMEGRPLALGAALGLIVLMLLSVPTTGRINTLLEAVP